MTKLEQYAKEILVDNDWDVVFKEFNNYLRNNCQTEDTVINFVFWFTHYVGLNFTIQSDYDAYDLMGYILSKVDLEKSWDDWSSILDDFANTALKIDLVKDPYYQFWRDKKVIEASRKYTTEDN